QGEGIFGGAFWIHDQGSADKVVLLLIEAGEYAGERHIELLELDAPAPHDSVEHVLVIADNLTVLDKFEWRIGGLGADDEFAALLDFVDIESGSADGMQNGEEGCECREAKRPQIAGRSSCHAILPQPCFYRNRPAGPFRAKQFNVYLRSKRRQV